MMRRFGFGLFACLFCLMVGCSKTAEKPKAAKIEPKFESPAKESASLVKHLPPIEQRIMSLEDIDAFKTLRIAEIICAPCSDAKTDVNAPKPDIKVDWRIRIDGKLGPKHDDIGMIAFRPQADRIAYAAKQGSKFHLIVDGNIESPEYDYIEYITFSPDGKRLAYGARIDNKWIAVVDGNAGPKYDYVGYFKFSPDSRHFTHTAGKQNGKKQSVVVDGIDQWPAYSVTGQQVFSPDSKRIAYTVEDDNNRFIFADGKPGPKHNWVSNPVFSADGSHLAYLAVDDNECYVVLDGIKGTSFEAIPLVEPKFGPNDNRLAYMAGLEENCFVVINDRIGPLFDGIGDRSIALSADGKRHAYAAKQGEQWRVVVDGQPGGPLYDGLVADGPVFSPDGNHFAYGAMKDGKYFVVVDGQPVPGYDNYDDISNNSMSFSPDGSHLIYKAKMGTSWFIVVDGKLGPEYDRIHFTPTVTEQAVEYLAEREGRVMRCRRDYAQAGDAVVSDCSQAKPDNLVFVKGGNFMNTKSSYYGKSLAISSFYVGRYEVTQKEWLDVMPSNPSKFQGDDLPVEMVSWYDCVEYCNKRSIKEGLTPYYNIDKNKKDPHNDNSIDDIKWTVTSNADANGYRLPTEAEWEYAAGGGRNSRSYTYCGSDFVDEVAWYWINSGDKNLTGENWNWPRIERNHCKTKPVGGKESNELGLYDMSGNVREWCWDWHESSGPDDPQGRAWKGGGWLGGEQCCEPSFRGKFEANGRGPDQGFRVCRSK